MRRIAFRPLAAAISCVVAVTVLGACETGGPSASNLDGLLLLAGDTSDTDLTAWRGEDAGRPVDIPDGTTWVAAGRADVLAIGLADGTIRISDPIRSDRDPTWTEAEAALESGDEAVGPFAFPAWDLDGGRLAALAGDFDGEPRLTLIDPTAGTASETELGEPIGHAPPAWVGRGPGGCHHRHGRGADVGPRRSDDQHADRRSVGRAAPGDLGRWHDPCRGRGWDATGSSSAPRRPGWMAVPPSWRSSRRRRTRSPRSRWPSMLRATDSPWRGSSGTTPSRSRSTTARSSGCACHGRPRTTPREPCVAWFR